MAVNLPLAPTTTTPMRFGQFAVSLRLKIALAIAIVVIGGMAIVVYTLTSRSRAELRQAADNSDTQVSEMLASQVSVAVKFKQRTAIATAIKNVADGPGSQLAVVYVVDQAGEVLAEYGADADVAAEVKALAASQAPPTAIAALERHNHLLIAIPIKNGPKSEIIGGFYAAWSRNSIDATVDAMSLDGAVIGGGLLVAIIGALLVTVSVLVTSPLTRMVAAMSELATGNVSARIPFIGRRDEVGSMAAAMQVFKNSAGALDAMRAEQAEAAAKAAEERRLTLDKIASAFESSVTLIVTGLATSATQMKESAEMMSATAEETTRQTRAATSAAEEASQTVRVAASETEELSKAIDHISMQIKTSASVAARAVERARDSESKIEKLIEATRKIGDVVDLIRMISGQTKLLALNATIEAAHSGEAGKSFGVVAAEVKALATQTAKATEDIAAQISAIHDATAETVDAMKTVVSTIDQTNEIASVIAGAIEGQRRSTQSIAQIVQRTSERTTEASANMDGVAAAADESGRASIEVLTIASELFSQSGRLRDQVEHFLGTVRSKERV